MSNELTVIQQKAVSLRSYLHNDKIKSTLADALPKWLSIDRMLRIVFSTAMKNPKILECSQESILRSVMMCAQLGLEPILGRAYLIPYQNSKNINGKWVKVYECQMQPGYQGLVDLARRSDNIADIWGHNVYENDEFDMMYGMGRDIHHRPWFMNQESKRKGPGEIIGAYVVWLLKDGTKHPEFMHISEIHKRRDVSQAFQWAETGDKSKGGGKKDSVWHKWPEEMNLKTVVKHSSKLVPSSIEFMEAVSLDDQSEAGASQSFGFAYDTGTQQIEQVQKSDDDLAAEFDAVTDEFKQINQFLAPLAKSGDMTIDQVKAEIVRSNDLGRCIENYRTWERVNEQRESGKISGSDSGTGAAGAGENSTDIENQGEPQTETKENDKGPGQNPGPVEKPTYTVEQALEFCRKTDPMSRYVAEKASMVKTAAIVLNIPTTGKLPREVHIAVLDAMSKKETADSPAGESQDAPDEEMIALQDFFNQASVDYHNISGGVDLFRKAVDAAGMKNGQRPNKEQALKFKEAYEALVADHRVSASDAMQQTIDDPINKDDVWDSLFDFFAKNYPGMNYHVFKNYLATVAVQYEKESYIIANEFLNDEVFRADTMTDFAQWKSGDSGKF